MRVLVACEFSGIVREAFKLRGHDAWSCDLLDTEIPGQHFQCDVMEIIDQDWDMMIAFPPCTYLCSSGRRWWKNRQTEQAQAIEFVKFLLNSNIERICLENPVGILSTQIRKPDQIIQPYQFGHKESKRTCLWLKNLPRLRWTNFIIGKPNNSIYRMSGRKDCSKNRSRTFQGIADAMASQWG